MQFLLLKVLLGTVLIRIRSALRAYFIAAAKRLLYFSRISPLGYRRATESITVDRSN